MRRLPVFAALAVIFGLTSCGEENAEVVVTETRELTTGDKKPKLNATSYERFRQTRPSARTDYAFTLPEGWRQEAATQIRLLNFSAGPEGKVEIYLSRTRGGIVSNIQRWYRQFSLEAPTEEALAQMPRLPLLGSEALFVRAAGTYSPGMGRPDAPGYGLAGVVAGSTEGVLTVKMVGPEAAVDAEIGRFKTFCASLQAGE